MRAELRASTATPIVTAVGLEVIKQKQPEKNYSRKNSPSIRDTATATGRTQARAVWGRHRKANESAGGKAFRISQTPLRDTTGPCAPPEHLEKTRRGDARKSRNNLQSLLARGSPRKHGEPVAGPLSS